MKLPVKLLTAVAALALLVVGVVSVQNNAQASHGPTHTAGVVNLTNLWSLRTTNSSPPSGHTYVGSGGTLYATMEDVDAGGDNQNVIMAGADILVVRVADADKNLAVTATVAGTAGATVTSFNIVVTAVSEKTPITSSASQIEVHEVAGGADVTDDFAVTFVNPGSSSANGAVGLASLIGAVDPGDYYIEFETSAVDTVDAIVVSTVDTTGVAVKLTETGRSTGVFEGRVQLVDPEDGTLSSNATATFGTTVADCFAAAPTACNTASLTVQDNSTVTGRYVDNTPTSGTSTTVTRNARVELSAPTPVVSSPAHNSATQVRNPSMSGTVTDTGSGLSIANLALFLDQGDDAPNDDDVLDTTGGAGNNLGRIGTGASGTLITANATGAGADTVPHVGDDIVTGSPTDGATSVSWTHTPVNLPTAGTAPFDHQVDFQVAAVDLAGNVGFSDSDTSTTGAGVGTDNHEAHVVNIDTKLPTLDSGNRPQTGVAWSTSTSMPNLTANNNRSIRVIFDDNVTGIDNTDFEVELDNGTVLVPTQAQVFTANSNGNSVFLTIGIDLPADSTPVVRIVGQVSDDAGNTQSAGSLEANDHLAPTVTVALSGGSGTGTGSTGASQLTKQTMIITITSDENLSSSPTVKIFAGDAADATTTDGPNPPAIAQGNNVWRATFNGSAAAFDDTTVGDANKKSVVVEATDASAQFNQRGTGNWDTSSSSAQVFTLDKTLPTLVNDGGTVSTSQRKPFVVIEFTDVHTVTVNTATVGGTNVLSDLATTDNKKFFFVPAADLALGSLTVAARATDLAGNQSPAGQDYTLTIGERAAFSLQLFAGWNAKSLPSNPIDPDITSVFTNTAVDQVVAYNAMDTASPWRIATRDAVSGAWTSSTSTPLNSIRTGNGYWIHTNNFAPQEVELEGAVAPGAGSPPPVVTIPTARGWNFVGIVSQSRIQTVGASGATLERITAGGGTNAIDVSEYFNTVDQGRVYRYDPSELRFEELTSVDGVEIGEALWVFISPQDDGSFPAIVP